MFFTGLYTGSIDALIDDFVLKAFLWASALVIALIIVSYEFIVMPKPDKPLLQASLFGVISAMFFLGTHHLVWLSVSVMIGREISDVLWLAPNIYVDTVAYTLVMFIFFLLSLLYLFYTSLCSED
ncbi:MAG: hypothetical protein C0179_04025 [Fervidicoccus sp.]|nr:MAG: hypothetical protein C0179_04025 [Fervidicoccus sp.]